MTTAERAAIEPGAERVSGLLPQLLRTPVTGLTCLGAIVVTGMWWLRVDQDGLLLDSRAFESEPWRLVTSTLLHASILHLLFNLTWTWRIGIAVEQRYGSLRTLALFLLLACGSSAAEFAFTTGGVGLSGLGYGLFGFLLVLRTRDPSLYEVISKRTVTVFIAWLFLCVILTWFQVVRIGNVAHASGLGLGWLTGRAVASGAGRRVLWIASIAASLVSIGAGATIGRPYLNRAATMSQEFIYRGYLASCHEDWGSSANFYARAAKIDPTQVDAWIGVACAQERMNRLDEAEKALDRAHALDPKNPDVRRRRGNLQYRMAHTAYEQGRIQDAIDLYEKCVARDPMNATAWFNLGIAYQGSNRIDRAIEAYEQAFEKDPSMIRARDAARRLKER